MVELLQVYEAQPAQECVEAQIMIYTLTLVALWVKSRHVYWIPARMQPSVEQGTIERFHSHLSISISISILMNTRRSHWQLGLPTPPFHRWLWRIAPYESSGTDPLGIATKPLVRLHSSFWVWWQKDEDSSPKRGIVACPLPPIRVRWIQDVTSTLDVDELSNWCQNNSTTYDHHFLTVLQN